MEKAILVGIHRAIHDKVDPELEVYRKILTYNDIPFIDLDSSELDFWKNLESVTHFIYKWSHSHGDHQIASAIIPVIQNHLKIKCFPSWETSWHYDDKIKQYYELKALGFPVVVSYIFYHKSKAIKFIENSDFPLVHKLKNGAGAMNVTLVKSKKDALEIINKSFGKGFSQNSVSPLSLARTLNFSPKKLFRHYAISIRNKFLTPERINFWNAHKNYVYFQKFLSNNEYDTRVTTAGLRVHAFRRFNRKNDFRASGGNKWDICPDNIDKRFLKIALEVSKKFGFQAMAYDFIYDENNLPRIIEMSCTYGGAGYPDFMNGYWDENLNRIEGRFWPQYFELVDLLSNMHLKCPENLGSNSIYRLISDK